MVTMKQTTATRIDSETAEHLEECARHTGLKSSDLIRLGVRMVIERIESEGGLLFRISPPTNRKKPSGHGGGGGRPARKRANREGRP
jgi:antitoxin component of RelBE/YafQ-DinJ toxin-antitoxin module